MVIAFLRERVFGLSAVCLEILLLIYGLFYTRKKKKGESENSRDVVKTPVR